MTIVRETIYEINILKYVLFKLTSDISVLDADCSQKERMESLINNPLLLLK